MTKKRKDLDAFVEEKTQARFAENQELSRQLRAVKAELGVATAAKKQLTEDLGALERVYEEALVLTPQPAWLKRGRKERTEDKRATLVSFLSDIHAGEVVRAEEMDGYNAYNLSICDARLKRFFERTVRLARTYFAGVSYDGIVLPLGGDLVSGDIHDELRATNELSVLDTTLWLAPRIVAGLELWAEEFGRVHVVSAPGNHGRDSVKPRHKRRSAHNADTHIARMVAYYFAASNKAAPDVTFDIPDSFDVGFKVYDWQFSMEHGDNMKFSGTAEIGALGPVKRGTLRKQNQAIVEGKPFHANLLGHFHSYVPAASQGFVMNGALKGYDEFARSWHMKPEPAQQALMVVTPEHSITTQTPIFVADRKQENW